MLPRDAAFPKPPKLKDEEYHTLLGKQGGVCFLCGRPPRRKRLCVDHCHFTGKVRGLLCMKCNYNLWWWERHPTAAAKLAMYLDPIRGDIR